MIGLLWRRLLIGLRILKLYRIDYGGEADWVSALTARQALRWWRALQAEAAGQEWLDETDEDERRYYGSGLEAVRVRDLSKTVGGDAEPPNKTMGWWMERAVVPGFIATSCF